MTPIALATAAAGNPLYEEVRGEIMRGLVSGAWKSGDVIPSEIEFARRFGVSKGTVRRALDDLVSERILVRRQGLGTFVATHTSRSVYHFFHLIGRDGSREPPVPKLLGYRVIKGSDDACDKLAVARQAKLINTVNLVSVGGKGVYLDDVLIPQTLFRGLTEKMYTQRESTIYALYQSRFNVNVIRISEELAAEPVPSAHARRLGIRPSTPVLVIERVAFTYQDKPVELRRSWVNTASHVYRSDLSKG